MIYFGFIILGVGFLNGLGQALNYADIDILKYFPGMSTYYQGLTVHGVFNALVMTFAFTNGFLSLTTARSLNRPLNPFLTHLSLWVIVIGSVMAAGAIATGQASVLYTFYPPLQAHWTFYLGAALVVISTWIVCANLLVTLKGWRRENPGERIPLMAFISICTYVMWVMASVGIATEVVGFLLPWSLGWIEGADPLLSRTLFWFTAHPIVYFWLLPAYVSWYVMVPKQAGGKLFSDTLTRAVFLMFIVLSIPVGFHHQYLDPGISGGYKALHTVLTFGVFFPSLVTAFSVMWALEMGARKRGGKGLVRWLFKLDWKNPSLVAQILAMIAFMLGGITGLINASNTLNRVVHNTAFVPGHFHLTVGTAVTLSFMGIAYWLIPYLTGRKLVAPGIARLQSWLYFIGVLVMARGLISGGMEGMPRRTMLMDSPYKEMIPSWDLAGLLTGIGGAIMFLGAVGFYGVLVGTALFGKKEVTVPDLPFTETISAPTKTVWGIRMDQFRYWVTVTIILVLIAYGPFLVQYLPPKLTSPGLQIF
jgi:cytochrome c oxidase subunit 1